MKKFNLLKKNIFLIGSGDLLLYFAKLLLSRNYNVTIISSKRHSKEFLQNNFFIRKIKSFVKFKILKSQNELIKFNFQSSVAICFGPSWVFKKQIRKLFNDQMYNIHSLPLPKFMGGAHYTWQILNSNYEGGVYLQKISDKIDRGPIIIGSKFKIPITMTKPIDFYNENFDHGKKFINKILKLKITKKINNNDSKFFLQSTYFPRLMTKINAYVNWHWSGEEIRRFCNAFDDPYSGAVSFCGKNKVIFKDVSIYDDTKYHPYCAGLVVRKKNNYIFVATIKGTLLIKDCFYENKSLRKIIKNGDRFFTPYKYLEKSITFRPKYN